MNIWILVCILTAMWLISAIVAIAAICMCIEYGQIIDRYTEPLDPIDIELGKDDE